MGERIGSRVLVGVVLAVVAAIGMTQPGIGADPAAAGPGVAYPTACPIAPESDAPSDPLSPERLPQDPCEPYDPCAYDSDGDGLYDCEDPCPSDPANGCVVPTDPPTTQPPTTQPPTTQPPTTAPPTAPTTAPAPTTSPTGTPAPTPVPGCQDACFYPREVALRATGTTLRGTVTSTASGCRGGATVTVWRHQKKGSDRRLVVVSSRASGAFRTTRPARAGRYYVTVASPEQPQCGPARSRALRITRA